MNLKEHLVRQMAFSHATFGPGKRMEGVTDHISKELKEVATAATSKERAEEWVDVVILGLDGLTRELGFDRNEVRQNPHDVAALVVDMLRQRQTANEARQWPDWRTAEKGKAIEHIKSA